jgi:hypothetical protein
MIMEQINPYFKETATGLRGFSLSADGPLILSNSPYDKILISLQSGVTFLVSTERFLAHSHKTGTINTIAHPSVHIDGNLELYWICSDFNPIYIST